MSSSQARASKREIRRAFGPAAMDTLVELEAAAQAHTKQIRDLCALSNGRLDGIRDLIEAHGGQIRELAKRVHAHDEQLRDHARALTEIRNDFYCRSFWGRLRWLFTGQ